MMCKKFLRIAQMSNADVMKAKSLSAELLGWEVRGPGDTARAMRRLATRYALPVAKQWALRYRPPKEIASHVLARIEAAHAAEKQRQFRKLAHDAKVTAQVAGPDHPAVVAAQAAVRAGHGDDPRAAAGVVGPALAPDRSAAPELNDLPLWQAMTKE